MSDSMRPMSAITTAKGKTIWSVSMLSGGISYRLSSNQTGIGRVPLTEAKSATVWVLKPSGRAKACSTKVATMMAARLGGNFLVSMGKTKQLANAAMVMNAAHHASPPSIHPPVSNTPNAPLRRRWSSSSPP